MLEDLPVLTRFQLRTGENLAYGCDRGDQQTPRKCDAEKIGLGPTGKKTCDQTDSGIALGLFGYGDRLTSMPCGALVGAALTCIT